MATPLIEIADRVFVLRYEFYDQTIGVVVGGEGVLVIDTRSTHRQAEELRADIERISPRPVSHVIDTHGHHDHAFGNRVFRPAPIWGHERCVEFLRRTGEAQRRAFAAAYPALAEDAEAVEIDPPDQAFTDRATLDLGGRTVELRHLGRGHTDNDIVVLVPDAGVLFAGDLLENGAPPNYGDAYPLDWPATAAALLGLASGRVVPGHGEVAGRAFAERQGGEIAAIAESARAIDGGAASLADEAARHPWGANAARTAIERALAQLRGDLD